MKIGTKSVLFGAHQFLIHPWFVAWGWDYAHQVDTLIRSCQQSHADERHYFDNGSGTTEALTIAEMIAEIQRLGKLCEAYYAQEQSHVGEIAHVRHEKETVAEAAQAYQRWAHAEIARLQAELDALRGVFGSYAEQLEASVVEVESGRLDWGHFRYHYVGKLQAFIKNAREYANGRVGSSALMKKLKVCQERAERAEADLRSVDQVLDRRDALADTPGRVDKILRMIRLAETLDPKAELVKTQAKLAQAEADLRALREQEVIP